MNRFELFLPVKYFWLVFILFSCVKSQKLKTNPFTPNINVTVEDLENWDFEVTTIDGGFCVYEKQLSEEILMCFYLSFEDDCMSTTAQEIVINLDSVQPKVSEEELFESNFDEWYESNCNEFQKDSLKILAIISKYGGIKTSDAKRLGSSEILTFNIKQKISNKILECNYAVYPNAVKKLRIETHWKDYNSD